MTNVLCPCGAHGGWFGAPERRAEQECPLMPQALRDPACLVPATSPALLASAVRSGLTRRQLLAARPGGSRPQHILAAVPPVVIYCKRPDQRAASVRGPVCLRVHRAPGCGLPLLCSRAGSSAVGRAPWPPSVPVKGDPSLRAPAGGSARSGLTGRGVLRCPPSHASFSSTSGRGLSSSSAEAGGGPVGSRGPGVSLLSG